MWEWLEGAMGSTGSGKAALLPLSYVRREASLFSLFSFSLTERALSAPTGHLPHWEEKANGRSFEPTCALNECVFAGSWRDVPYKYAARGASGFDAVHHKFESRDE